MRVLILLAALIAIAGCGSDIKGHVIGTWHVDPASVNASRLESGANSKPEWDDAVKSLSQATVQFNKDGTVSASALGETSTATWTVKGKDILIQDGHDNWPSMRYDSNGPRIHLTAAQNGDWTQMDLIKSR